MLTYGSGSHVSFFGIVPLLLDTDSRNDSTGSLSLVRTILNYQNVTNDPTCETPVLENPRRGSFTDTERKG